MKQTNLRGNKNHFQPKLNDEKDNEQNPVFFCHLLQQHSKSALSHQKSAPMFLMLSLLIIQRYKIPDNLTNMVTIKHNALAQ